MNEVPVYLHSFESILPHFSGDQNHLTEWTLASHARFEALENTPLEDRQKNILKRFLVSEKHIARRYFECPDVDLDWEKHHIFALTPKTHRGVDIETKNLFFSQRVLNVFEQIYDYKNLPGHLIHVTCTGYVSPSAPQVYFSKQKDPPAITHAYHMGCYASLPSIRLGKALIASETEKSVDIVHTEICSLHLDPTIHTPEQMVVQSLFADGHIGYRLDHQKKGMRVLCIHEKILPDTSKDMTWIPGSHGMMMTLSKDVPVKISEVLESFIDEICQKSGVDKREIMREAIFAIHPGGPKIIDTIQKKLELDEVQVMASKKVLFERGNMSSATLPHVWKEIQKENFKDKRWVLSLAFGPGLTVFGALFELVQE